MSTFAKQKEEGNLDFDRELRNHQMADGDLELSICPKCNAQFAKKELADRQHVCPNCGYHYRIGAYDRLRIILDADSFEELDETLHSTDPLDFPGYREKLNQMRKKTGLDDAVVMAVGTIKNIPVVVVVLDSRFSMGSMGVVVGEKITRAVEYADEQKLPLLIFSASGGARMQEGIFSLMQMAKTSSALARFSGHRGFFISILTDPTMGGVTASFASLGDIILAEPGALIGFAGARVIEQTIGQSLPEGFQRAEYLEEHGFIDAIVPRPQLRDTLAQLLLLHQPKQEAVYDSNEG